MLDLDRITHPLRLAAGSHQPGSGKGCAMNVISYINGDKKITDFPECSARPLARIVQQLNDHLAGPDGYLSPEDSVLVIDLGWLTKGTSGASRNVMLHWLSDVLVDQRFGVINSTTNPRSVDSVHRVADLLMREYNGGSVSLEEWQAARKNAAAYADAAAYAAAAYADAAADAADAAADAAAYAAAAYAAGRLSGRIEFTRWAIVRWRELMQLDTAQDIEPAEVDTALALING